MTTTATLPDDLELREGDELVLRAVAKNGGLVVTGVILTMPKVEPENSSFSAKWGGTMSKVTDPGDVVLTHINEKHVK